jgi:crotonobetainyl-CoA:carnitine CoA-transferase CaiB-like acyl-CoA transferase
MSLLSDISVLDVTQVISGSFASMMLADMGADVVKVERPETGDFGRANPPFVDDRSAYFMSMNRNKKSVTLDFSADEGQEAFLRLAEKADVIIENLKPGTLTKFGLDYEAVRERNEGIIYCSVSGFGQNGPYADLPALDIIVQAFSGNMSMTGPKDGQPYRSGIPVGDIAGSMYASQSVLAALHQRDRTGEGQYIDVSMAEGLISWLTVRAGYTFATGEPYPRTGNQMDEVVPYGLYETKDSYIALAAVQDHHWDRLCELLDRPELATDEQFEDMASRRENREQVDEVLAELFGDRTTDELFDVLAREIPVAPVHDTKSVFEDEHVRERGLVEECEVDDFQHPFINMPVQFSDATTDIYRNPPTVGEHTREELATVGYDEETLDRLEADGVI